MSQRISTPRSSTSRKSGGGRASTCSDFFWKPCRYAPVKSLCSWSWLRRHAMASTAMSEVLRATGEAVSWGETSYFLV